MKHRGSVSGRRRWPALFLLAGLTVVPVGTAGASCAGPELRIGGSGEGPPTVHAGEQTSVRGSYFTLGCDDYGSATVFGCSTDEGETVRPMRNVKLVLRQGDRRWDLASEDAGTARQNELGKITWQVRVPDDVREGPATLVAGTARLRVAVGASPE
jgi:hypothetical protein